MKINDGAQLVIAIVVLLLAAAMISLFLGISATSYEVWLKKQTGTCQCQAERVDP